MTGSEIFLILSHPDLPLLQIIHRILKANPSPFAPRLTHYSSFEALQNFFKVIDFLSFLSKALHLHSTLNSHFEFHQIEIELNQDDEPFFVHFHLRF